MDFFQKEKLEKKLKIGNRINRKKNSSFRILKTKKMEKYRAEKYF
jgi:hypothetical protein